MTDLLYGGWGLAELVALIQKHPWPAFAIALVAGLIVYMALHPERFRGDGGGDLSFGEGGDCGSDAGGSCD